MSASDSFEVVLEEAEPLTREEEEARIEAMARAMEEDEKRRIYQESLDVICMNYPRTGIGNNKRFIQRFGGEILYCHPWKIWYIWQGTHWAPDESGRIMGYGKYTVIRIDNEAGKLPGEHERKMMYAWSGISQEYSRIRSMIGLSASDVPVLPAALDADKNLLNFPNGTLEIDTGTFREHRQADLCSKIMGAPYNPAAECPQWLKFIDEIFVKEHEEGEPPERDEDLIKFVQRALGYTLTADIKERAVFLCYGSGANGKSTLLNTIAAAMGDYSRQTESSTFTVQRNEAVRNDLAALKGARLVLALESGKDKKLDEALVKQLSGGDKIAARFLFKEFFEYIPEFKIWWGFNHRPQIDDSTDSIWDRIKLIPFNLRIPAEKRDLDLPAKLLEELPGIIQWMLQGLQEYRKIGLADPEIVKAATKEYQEEQDILGEWRADRCDKGTWTPAAELYTSYHGWCTDRGEEAMSPRKFYLEMGERYTREKKDRKRGYRGIKLKSIQELPLDQPSQEKITSNQARGQMGTDNKDFPILEKCGSSENLENIENSIYPSPSVPEPVKALFPKTDQIHTSYAGMTRADLTNILDSVKGDHNKLQDPEAFMQAWKAAGGNK